MSITNPEKLDTLRILAGGKKERVQDIYLINIACHIVCVWCRYSCRLLKWSEVINFSIWGCKLVHHDKIVFSIWDNDNRWKMFISTEMLFHLRNTFHTEYNADHPNKRPLQESPPSHTHKHTNKQRKCDARCDSAAVFVGQTAVSPSVRRTTLWQYPSHNEPRSHG